MSTASDKHSANGIRIFDLPAIEGRPPNDPPRKVALNYTPTSWGIVDVSTGMNIEPYAINWPVEEPISRSEDGHEGIYLSVSRRRDEIEVSAGLSALSVQFLGAYAKYTDTIVKEHPTGILPDWCFELPKVYITLKPSEVTRRCFPCQTAEGFQMQDKRFLACGGCHSEYYCSKKCQKMGWTLMGHKERCKAIKDQDTASLKTLNKGTVKAVYRNGPFVTALDEN